MELQHINVKIYLESSGELRLEDLVPIFHGWIQEQVCDELLIDVADYRHVPAGPGVVLIGHEADYSLDDTDERPGLRYNRKAILPGSNRDRFFQALRAALDACDRLEADERLRGKIRFGRRKLRLFVNDRKLAPNVTETYAAVERELRDFFAEVGASNHFEMQPEADARKLFGVEVQLSQPITLESMASKTLN